ncbi:MAG: leucyl aminopeptidase [Candidatus Phytoplasma pruni]|uniref:leucyl aminopeptidase n=1 Tax=Poinsettia branch-inducing phytoplasma TaxID=138647 RepID=UPI000366B202|nr:leucyl aminopeptidase [Poinsettia branch-inducing phytoplasma]WEK82264.1 MAG: leucyl aminopeptidase [Candidatus Phytoplasma pruni]
MKVSFLSELKSFNKKSTVVVLKLEDEKQNVSGVNVIDFQGQVEKACQTEQFKGKAGSVLKLVHPEGYLFSRLLVVGLGKNPEKNEAWKKAGRATLFALKNVKEIVVLTDFENHSSSFQVVMDYILEMMLKSYTFDRYHTKPKKDFSEMYNDLSVVVVTKEASVCQKEFHKVEAVVQGSNVARDLVNEPANVLGTDEFVSRIKKLNKMGIEVDFLDKKQMAQLGMNSLLAVAQGSDCPPYLAIMKWQGSSSQEAPLSFVGKGVVFDSGGISIKPSGGMEDMKGDMGGAAIVVGLMHTLAARKAQVNVVAVVGLVENMPSGKAQRPGDIVTSMSGQTIEVITTDAEGRMVLADALYYTKIHVKPQLIVDLATLTGAIMVALGGEHAGLFSNNDDLAQKLLASGQITGEKLWLMPLSEKYDRLIDSKFADMRNSSGRLAGSITAAQFLKRFVGEDTPWAHIDIAGVAFNDKVSTVNNSWATGFGVRLLNQLVANYYEKK